MRYHEFTNIPGQKRIVLEQGLTSAAGAATRPRIGSKLPGLDGGIEWRLVGVEMVCHCSSVTTSSTASTVWRTARLWSPTNIIIEGWPENAYSNARGDAVYWNNLTRYGKPLAMNNGFPASITTGAMRFRWFYPFAGMAGRKWNDSAPRADLLKSIEFGRDDTYFLAGDSWVAAPTVDFFAWVAPCQKVGEVPIPFSFGSWPASSATEVVVAPSDRVHTIVATDADEALTNTTTLLTRKVGGRQTLDSPTDIAAMVSDWNRSVLAEGARSADAISEVVAASGAAASPELLPILWNSGIGKSYQKALANSAGSTATFSAALDATLADVHYSALRSWDPLPGGEVEKRYLGATENAGRNRVATNKREGYTPGTPFRVV